MTFRCERDRGAVRGAGDEGSFSLLCRAPAGIITMLDQQKSDSREDVLQRVIGYFDRSVLASYKDAPEKYILETDNFEGHVRMTEPYYTQLEAAGDMSDYIDVRFGYRTLRNGQIQSEALILYFTDGSIMGIDTGSNIWNLASEHEGLKAGDLHVDLNLQWVPPPK